MRLWAAGRLPASVQIHSGFPLAVYEATDTSEYQGPWTSSQLLTVDSMQVVRAPGKLCQQRSLPGISVDESQPDIRNRRLAPSAIARCRDRKLVQVLRIRISVCRRDFHLTESKYFQFRGDFLNAFNNVQLGHPNTNFPSSTFGLINTSQPARNIQFALKFYY